MTYVINEVIKVNQQYIKLIVLVASIGGGFFLMQREADTKVEFDQAEVLESESSSNEVMENSVMMVDVKGAVKNPGVYEVEGHMRVDDVIALAGGLTAEADDTMLNKSIKVYDEMMIYVPTQMDDISSNAGSQNTKISLNRATSEELQTLTGIGPSKATAIITYREEKGPFKKIEDLLNVSGIGEATYAAIKDDIMP